MNHHDHVNLLRGGVPKPGGVWADLGSGGGAFTLALAELLGLEGIIYSVDKEWGALQGQARLMRAKLPSMAVHYLTADFTRRLDLPPLDGVVMANALHFVEPRLQPAVVRQAKGYLRPGGCMMVVEYNVDAGNMWVPHPFSFTKWEAIAREAGFANTQQLATAPSRFLGGFYSALSW
jgi:SAM-dependent methyltransferase